MYCNFLNLFQIDNEFRKLFAESENNFLTKFSTFYVPRILAYANAHKKEIVNQTSHIKDGKTHTN